VLTGGNSAATTAAAADRSVALASVGGSFEGLFLKLFLGSLVFCLIAGPVMLASVLGWLDHLFPEENALNKYLSVAFLPLLVGTAIVFIGPFDDHYLRFIGFLMAIVTLVGASALVQVLPNLTTRISGSGYRVATVGLLLLLLPVATMGLHPSPWMFQDTPQVTEQEVTGYEAAFEHSASGIPFSGIRGGSERYADAIYGPDVAAAQTTIDDGIPYSVFGNNLTSYYEDGRYVPVRTADYEREVGIYKGFRYSERGFEELESTPRVNRVQSTDEFQLYLLQGEET
jgi:hypothetical protein